jgi:hypothetical protein
MSSQFGREVVWLHPEPRGIIQFIGAFIFGSVPASTYRPLVQELYSRGFSLVLHRFPLNPLQFNHWDVALGLLQRARRIRNQIATENAFPATASADRDFYLDPTNTLWLGHSLGCKFLLLLEILSNEPIRREAILRKLLPAAEVGSILSRLSDSSGSNSSNLSQGEFFPVIRNQPTILMAPEISNTVRILRSGFQFSNRRALPNKTQTESLILDSTELFHLTRVVSFDWDGISVDDVDFLRSVLIQRGTPTPVVEHLYGWHLEPLSARVVELADKIEVGFQRLLIQPRAEGRLA